ncbi:MAG: acetyl-CoA acetyltransferase [Actinomycetia bacterium]|nr:acetyl-CoA acetyltransferase [Actinomycetes bacterium]
MVVAAEQAFADAGIDSRLTGAVLVPRGSWGAGDPERIVAQRLGAPEARTTMAELGIPQLSIMRRACELIAEGTVDVALVVGAETRHRAGVAKRAGVELTPTPGTGEPADEVLKPSDDFMTRPEIERKLTVPAHQYAVIESTLRAAAGRTPAEQSAHLGRLWHAFAEVAAANPDGWDRSNPSAEEIATPGPRNRMLAAPYTKLLCSQWNVDQAGAMVFISARAAEAMGVASDRWVHPLGFAESNLMQPMPTRRDIHRWPAFALAAERLFELTGRSIGDVGPIDLYSCFPAAVETCALELGLPFDRPLTVTGGMTFGGGPLNNYTFQSVVAMARRLREEPGAIGLTTSVSGLLTKPAIALWSTDPGDRPFAAADVTAEARAATATVEVDGDATGAGTVVGCTVLYEDGEPATGVAVVQVGDVRTVALTDDRKLALDMVEAEWVGRGVTVPSAGVLAG